MTPSMHVLSLEEALEKYEVVIGHMPYDQTKTWRDKIDPFLRSHGYFSSPASVKYHLNCEGGLFRHSVGVAVNALALNDLWFRFPKWKVVYAALLHDIGKLGMIDMVSKKHQPRYIPNPAFEGLKGGTHARWVSVDPVTGYTFLDIGSGGKAYPFVYGMPDGKIGSLPFVDMTINNVLLAAQLTPLPLDVLQAIQFADGHYVDANKTLEHKAHPLSHLLHWADWYQGCIVEAGWVTDEGAVQKD